MRIVIGCAGLGDLPDPLAFLDHAWALGCNTFDLGFVYGRKSEASVGRWLAERASAPLLCGGGVKRSDVILIGKGGHPVSRSPTASKARLDQSDIESDLNESLARLGVDSFDVYLLHRDDPQMYPDIGIIVEMMHRLVLSGKIGAWGVSNWSSQRLSAAIDYATSRQLSLPVMSSPQYSLTTPNRPLWDGTRSLGSNMHRCCSEHGVQLLCWSPLAQGCLAKENGIKPSWDSDENAHRLSRLDKLAVAKHISRSQAALCFVLSSTDGFAVVGTRNVDHLHELVSVSRLSFTDSELAFLVSDSPEA